MARRSRMGSDPLSNKDKKKEKDEARSAEGLDALIRDTRKSAGAAKKAGTKKKTSADMKPAAAKKKTTTRKKKKAASVKPSQAKAKKKPVPEIKPGAVIDLEFPHDSGTTPEPGTVSDLAPKAEVVTTQETAPEATEKEEKTAPLKEKEKTPEESAPATVKEKTSPESRTGKTGESPGSTDEQEDMDQFLAFRLGDESFAFEIERVREVLSYTKVTKVPNTPDFMSGVINLRGNVVPVVDLRLLFGLGQGEMTEDTCIIIVDVALDDETLEIGARADAVREVFDIKKDDIEPAPTLGEHLDTEFMLGMGKKDDEFLLLLDIEKVFSLENLSKG